MNGPPHSPEVEASVLGQMLARPAVIPEVIGTMLDPGHFYQAANQLLYATLRDGYFDGTATDPLSVGERLAGRLARLWSCDEQTAVRRVQALAGGPFSGSAVAHAQLVKRDADYRALLEALDRARTQIGDESASPEEVAGVLAQETAKVATSSVLSAEIVSFADAGRAFVREARQAMGARAIGQELGAYFGIPAIDLFTKGLRPGELWMFGGPPGEGKTAVSQRAMLNFARRQAQRPPERQIASLVLSLEMGPVPTSERFAAMLTGVNTTLLREGTVTDADLQQVVAEWRKFADVPLYLNYASGLRYSQLRALISEAIRRHNVGVVMIDHFRYFHPDKRLSNRTDEEGDKAAFLKEQIAKDLNVAVICLAHTRKPDQSTSHGRPKLADLRGSQDIAAHADFVSFVFRPWLYASDRERDAGEVDETAAEMIWAKNRHANTGTGYFTFDAANMRIF